MSERVAARPVLRGGAAGLSEAIALYEKNKNSQHVARDWRYPNLISILGGIFLAQKRYAEAEPLLLQGYAGMKQGEWAIIAPWRYRLTEAGECVVRYYEETNQPEKARSVAGEASGRHSHTNGSSANRAFSG